MLKKILATPTQNAILEISDTLQRGICLATTLLWVLDRLTGKPVSCLKSNYFEFCKKFSQSKHFSETTLYKTEILRSENLVLKQHSTTTSYSNLHELKERITQHLKNNPHCKAIIIYLRYPEKKAHVIGLKKTELNIELFDTNNYTSKEQFTPTYISEKALRSELEKLLTAPQKVSKYFLFEVQIKSS